MWLMWACVLPNDAKGRRALYHLFGSQIWNSLTWQEKIKKSKWKLKGRERLAQGRVKSRQSD